MQDEMNERETARAINDDAATWVARIDASALDPDVQAAFDRWLAGDDRRRGAFFRAQSAWRMLDRASVIGARGRDTIKADRASEPLAPTRRRILWGGGALAATLVAGLGGALFWTGAPDNIETALGEIRRVPLRDGSFAEVNTATRLAIDLQPNIRNIDVETGEVWFQVAKDHRRPFVVAAGDVRVRAVGTAFAVRRMGDGTDVRVTEGVVEVWTINQPDAVRRLAAGTRIFVNDIEGPAEPVEASLEIDRTLAWRNGQLIFDGDTLAAAAAEFNRYNRVKLEVAPSLAAERVVGRFRTNEPGAFARAASAMLGAHTEIDAHRIKLSQN
jgi:transmembrane sensor